MLKIGAKAGKLMASTVAATVTNTVGGVASSRRSDKHVLMHGQLLINIYSAKGKYLSQ